MLFKWKSVVKSKSRVSCFKVNFFRLAHLKIHFKIISAKIHFFQVPQMILGIFQIRMWNLYDIGISQKFEKHSSVNICRSQQRFLYEPSQYCIQEQWSRLFGGSYWFPSTYFILLNVFKLYFLYLSSLLPAGVLS